ncbi:MAG: hypothetical protein M1823_005430 [Watsoniomyces obsoletus]|nr:MAG: hypothetical protein M1823_005430 [Watsoniomyces obsoletus]
MNAGKKIGPIPRPIPPPTTLPSPGNTSISSIIPTRPSPHPDLNAPHRHTSDSSYSSLAGPTGDFSVPDLSELGMSGLATTPHRGGETLALSSLDKIISNETYTATFQKPNTAPTAFHPQSTTLLSPHLHFGSLSIRTFYWAVQDVVDRFNNPPPGVPKKKEKASTPPTSLIGQLLFRDMYFGAQAPLGFHFGQTQGNSHCRFIPWHLQTIYSPHTGLSTGEYTIDSPIYETWFLRWKFGMTGYPFIDALMRQLKQEGWIHHLGRHAVACFLTRGGCYIDWMRGAEVFEEWLIDHETAANIGNWQWLSCTAFFSMFYRIYSPVAFGRKWDPKGSFVRRYVKELEGYPDKWIYEPWLCPKVEQEKAGCRVVEFEEGVHLNGVRDVGVAGKDEGEKPVPGTYPKPMFDFPTRRTICLEGMKKAYKVGLYGNDPRVKDGTWRDLFPDEGVEGFSKEMTGTVKSHEDDALDDDDEEKKNNKTIEEENEDAVSDPGTGMRITDVKAGMKRRRRGREGSVSGDEYMKETETKRIQGRGTKVGTGAGNNGAAIAGKKKMGKQFEKGDKKQMTLDALVSSLSTSTAAAAPAAGRDSSSGTRISERLKKRS